MKTKRYCLTLDLKNDPDLIAEYKKHHEKIWPEVYESIKASGIVEMEIYLYGNRLFMIMETDENFSFEKKRSLMQKIQKLRNGKTLMWKLSAPVPGQYPEKNGKLWKEFLVLLSNQFQ